MNNQEIHTLGGRIQRNRSQMKFMQMITAILAVMMLCVAISRLSAEHWTNWWYLPFACAGLSGFLLARVVKKFLRQLNASYNQRVSAILRESAGAREEASEALAVDIARDDWYRRRDGIATTLWWIAVFLGWGVLLGIFTKAVPALVMAAIGYMLAHVIATRFLQSSNPPTLAA